MNVIVALIMIVLVLVQNGKSEGLDPFVGSKAETFFGKNKTRSLDAKLQKMTVICAVCFFVLTAVLAIFA
ncbi:MAG: preprotein translocase subunit SecG [Clostridia bacterium]|nr:preprotein translocase subunit SecG [Clostridia bacterium]